MARGRVALGIIILAFGVIMLLNGLNYTTIGLGELIAKYWPLLLVGLGIDLLIGRTGAGGKLIGGLVFLLGIGLLGKHMWWPQLNVWGLFWPLVLIILGLNFLFGCRTGGGCSNIAVMSGVERKDAWNLQSGSYLAFMGGIELDLRRAVIPEGTTRLTLTAFMGGIDIVVPPDLAVDCEGTAILGGVEFFHKNGGGIIATLHERQGDMKGKQVVRLSCFAALGGITVKSAAVGEKVDW